MTLDPEILEAFRERVFDSFFHLPEADMPDSGLGLAIVKQVT